MKVERSTRCVRRCAACGQREDPTHSLAVHYDCLTCIACKSFFYRSGKQLRAAGITDAYMADSDCYTKHLDNHTRYAQCLAAGMDPALVLDPAKRAQAKAAAKKRAVNRRAAKKRAKVAKGGPANDAGNGNGHLPYPGRARPRTPRSCPSRRRSAASSSHHPPGDKATSTATVATQTEPWCPRFTPAMITPSMLQTIATALRRKWQHAAAEPGDVALKALLASCGGQQSPTVMSRPVVPAAFPARDSAAELRSTFPDPDTDLDALQATLGADVGFHGSHTVAQGPLLDGCGEDPMESTQRPQPVASVTQPGVQDGPRSDWLLDTMELEFGTMPQSAYNTVSVPNDSFAFMFDHM